MDARSKTAGFLFLVLLCAAVLFPGAHCHAVPALDKPEYFASYLAKDNPANRAAVFQALESPITPPVIERQNEMQDMINELLGEVATGALDPQTALDMAKDELDALIQ